MCAYYTFCFLKGDATVYILFIIPDLDLATGIALVHFFKALCHGG